MSDMSFEEDTSTFSWFRGGPPMLMAAGMDFDGAEGVSYYDSEDFGFDEDDFGGAGSPE